MQGEEAEVWTTLKWLMQLKKRSFNSGGVNLLHCWEWTQPITKLSQSQACYFIWLDQHLQCIKKAFWHEVPSVLECLYLSLFDGGVLVITEVGEGWVGFMASNPWWSGSEPGRTMVGVGVELAAVRGGTSCKSQIHDNFICSTCKKCF